MPKLALALSLVVLLISCATPVGVPDAAVDASGFVAEALAPHGIEGVTVAP